MRVEDRSCLGSGKYVDCGRGYVGALSVHTLLVHKAPFIMPLARLAEA